MSLFKQKSKLLRISSSDRTRPNDPVSNFTIDLKSSQEGLTDIIAIQPISISLLNNFYNVTEDFKFFYYLGGSATGTKKSITIPQGFYDIDSFMTVGFKPTFDTAESVNMPYVASTNNNSTLDPTTFKLHLDFTTQITFVVDKDNKCALSLGFKEGETITTDSNGLVISSTVINLSQVPNVFICSPQLTDRGIIEPNFNTTKTDAIVSVPLDNGFGLYCYWNNTSSMSSMITFKTPTTLSTLEFALRDHTGSLLNGGNQVWNGLFKIYYL